MKLKTIFFLGFSIPAFCLFWACQKSDKKRAPVARKMELQQPLIAATSEAKKQLSEYGFFEGPIAKLRPAAQVYAYSINSPLFTNYAYKKRFIYLPEGTAMTVENGDSIAFPEGSVLIKNFYYPEDFRLSEGDQRILETRLLVKSSENWEPLNYIWNAEQTAATLDYLGRDVPVSWTHSDGELKTITYPIPNVNQCKDCHNSNGKVVPVGPRISQWNRINPVLAPDQNQLIYFTKNKLLQGFSPTANHPKLPEWENTEAPLIPRAKSYLEANCAHCHNPNGSAKNSGLYLNFTENDPRKNGIYKPPVAAGKGSGNLQFSIVPGQPEKSIMLYRMQSTEPGVMMPETGQAVVHQQGVALIAAYIRALQSE